MKSKVFFLLTIVLLLCCKNETPLKTQKTLSIMPKTSDDENNMFLKSQVYHVYNIKKHD